MALSHYLSHFNNPQVAFTVIQQRFKKVEDAIGITLKIESYLLKPAVVGSVNPKVDECTVGAIGSSSGATGCIPRLSEQTSMQAVD